MRKIKLQMQITVDNFAGGPNGELDWMLMNWDNDLNQYVKDLTASIDCIILGRKLAEGFVPYWADVASNPNDPSYSFGKIMYETAKVVFTKTIEKSDWPNTVLANGDIINEISELKNKEGKDIIVYGGVSFVSDLLSLGLIDELHLFINPVLIGNGLSIYKNIKEIKNLKLIEAKSFECGIVLISYKSL